MPVTINDDGGAAADPPARDLDQDLDGRIGTAEDVRAVFELLPNATVCLRGQNHVIVAANAAYRAMVGRQRLIGYAVREVMPEIDGQNVLEVLDRVWATGVPEAHREWRIEMDHDGSGVSTEIYVDFAGQPFFDADGNVEVTIFETADSTERARARIAAEQAAAEVRKELFEAREVVTTLQHAMLPTRLPVLPGVDVAASYLVAESESSAGGDWFDAVPVGEGRVVLVIGDVVGHGVEASVVMGGLRAVLNSALLATGDDLVAALEHLDRYARGVLGARAATVCLALVDPAAGIVRYCTAGHPPPLVVSTDGARFLEPSGASPLATTGRFPVSETSIGPGEAVLLYSDGLVERPGRTPTQATAELARVAANVYRGDAPDYRRTRLAEQMSTTTLELLVRPTGHTDDVTVVAAHLLPGSVPSVDVNLPATPEALQDARVETAVIVESIEADKMSVMPFHHAVSELVANAAEHAYVDASATDEPRQSHRVRLQAELTPEGVLRAIVSDDGQWRTRPNDHPGLGLSIVRQLADRLEIRRGDDGDLRTVATFEVKPYRTAQLLTSAGTRPPLPPPQIAQFVISVNDPPYANSDSLPDARDEPLRIVVTGPVDLASADALRSTLTHAATGERRIVLDLEGVTLLASRGVQVIAEFASAALIGERLRVHAPAGTPAQHVLDLVNLDIEHTTTPPTP